MEQSIAQVVAISNLQVGEVETDVHGDGGIPVLTTKHPERPCR